MKWRPERSFTFSQCPTCGYDLRGRQSDSDCCPECGQTQETPGVTVARERRFFSALRRAIVIYLTIAAVVSAGLFILMKENAITWTPVLVILAPALILMLAVLCAKRTPE